MIWRFKNIAENTKTHLEPSLLLCLNKIVFSVNWYMFYSCGLARADDFRDMINTSDACSGITPANCALSNRRVQEWQLRLSTPTSPGAERGKKIHILMSSSDESHSPRISVNPNSDGFQIENFVIANSACSFRAQRVPDRVYLLH